MKRVLCSELPRRSHPTKLPDSEAAHLIKVLRLRDGDFVEAMDGQGHAARVVLRTRNGPTRIEFIETEREKEEKPPAVSEAGEVLPIVLEVAMLKGEAMEWVIEKSVELGVQTLAPTLTAHTIVQFKNKGAEAFRERWQKIADQSLKQCGRLRRMDVLTPVSLEQLLLSSDCSRLWFDEKERGDAPHLAAWLENRKSPGGKIRLLIGPEGGWSDSERDILSQASSQTEKVSLGPLVLRAETAAISAVSLLAGAFRSRQSQ